MVKMKIKFEIAFKIKAKKMIAKMIKKKSHSKVIHRIADYEFKFDERGTSAKRF